MVGSTELLSKTITMRILKGIMQTTVDVGSKGIRKGVEEGICSMANGSGDAFSRRRLCSHQSLARIKRS